MRIDLGMPEGGIVSLPRKITNRELADLSTRWENPSVDTRHYIQCACVVFEVDGATYTQHKEEGGLCQIQNGRFYIA